MTLAEKCKEIRKKKGLTQRELAKLIYSTQTEISFMGKGFIPVNTGKIELLEYLYNEISVED